MESPLESVHSLAAQAYASGVAVHGDLNLELIAYTCHLVCVVTKRLGKSPDQGAAFAFVTRLHTTDLYLSVACARESERAWNRFSVLYQKCIAEIASSVQRSRGEANELAESILGHIFLPDKAGRSRIASYDGRSSLTTWLSSVISHKALNDRASKANGLERLNELPEIADYSAVRKIEIAVRADRCESRVRDSLIGASKNLTERERFVLALRYVDQLQGTDIARLLRVHPSTVTRQLQQICDKLRDQIVSHLSSKYELDSYAIEECLVDMLENPSHSLLSLIKAED